MIKQVISGSEIYHLYNEMGFPGGTVVKNLRAGAYPAQGSILALGRCSPLQYGNPLQYSCLENSIDRDDLWAIQSMGSQRVGHD